MANKIIQLKNNAGDKLYPISATFKDGPNEVERLIDLFYPVGSYYETSDASFNPNTAWGGTWVEDTKGRVTVAKSDSGTFATVGKTGGAETHTLTIEEMPKITASLKLHGSEQPSIIHNITGAFTTADDGGYHNGAYRSVIDMTQKSGSYSYSAFKMQFGNDQPHNNLQPYIVVKRWHRTA